jgi:hypothetical protein
MTLVSVEYLPLKSRIDYFANKLPKTEISNIHRRFVDVEVKNISAITTHLSTNLGYDGNQDSNYLLSHGPRYVDYL